MSTLLVPFAFGVLPASAVVGGAQSITVGAAQNLVADGTETDNTSTGDIVMKGKKIGEN